MTYNNDEFDKHFRDVEKAAKRTFGAVLVVWFVSLLISLGVLGVLIWAIISVVNHYTS